MDSQLTIRIPGALGEALDEASRRTGLKRSEIVRQALRGYLEGAHPPPRPPADRVRHLLGSVDSGVPDLAERHRDYVLESLNRGR